MPDADDTTTNWQDEYEQFLRRYGIWLDNHLDACHGSCHLRNPDLRKIVVDSLPFFDGKRYDLNAATVMPNHCHVAVRPYPGYPLEEILQSWKGFTSLKINERLQTDGRFWQPESYDRIIRGEEHFRKVVRYILRNPGMANLGDSSYWMHFGGRECGGREWGSPKRAK